MSKTHQDLYLTHTYTYTGGKTISCTTYITTHINPNTNLNNLDPATSVFPDLLITMWLAGAVNRVNIPSGEPSGYVYAWMVLESDAVINRLF